MIAIGPCVDLIFRDPAVAPPFVLWRIPEMEPTARGESLEALLRHVRPGLLAWGPLVFGHYARPIAGRTWPPGYVALCQRAELVEVYA